MYKDMNKKNKIGRPTNYKGEFCVKAKQYIKDFYKDEPVPTIAGLACFLKIPRQKIYDYKKEHDEFRDIIEILLALQEKKILSGSLTNKLNSKISTLMLSKHGYSNKESIQQTTRFSLTDLFNKANEEDEDNRVTFGWEEK